MNKQQLTVAFAALLLSASALHAQHSSSTPSPHGFLRAFSHMRADTRAILSRQVAGQSKTAAAKPTADENLVAVASIYGAGTELEHDSTTYRYSGTRGSNLTSNFYSYEDNYFPAASLENSIYAQQTPTLEYDTSKYYTLSGSTMLLNEWTSRTYNAANDVMGMAHKTYDETGALTTQAYLTVGYNSSNQLTNSTVYDDTSALLSGFYQLTRTLNAVYSGALRTSDTSDNFFGGLHSRSANTYTYDGAGNMILREQADYDETSATWVVSNRNQYAYDAAGRLINNQSEYWDGMAWTVSLQDSFAYTGTSPNFTLNDQRFFNFGGGDPELYRITTTLNANGAWDSLYSYSDEGSSGSLVLNGTYGLQYNSNDHLTLIQGVGSDPSTGATSPTIARYYYEPAGGTGVADAHKTGAAFASLYPNPASHQATINLANPQGRVDVVVTNAAGQLLYQQSSLAQTNIPLNAAGLPAGSYHVTVTMNGAVQTLKLVKQ